MIHARNDYNRIQDPAVNDPSLLSEGSTPIGEDEPVFLIRARDLLGPETVRAWADAYVKLGALCDPVTHQAVIEWADRMEEWQNENECKAPDTPRSEFEETTE